MTKFIKAHFGNKESSKVDRVRPWLLAKLNKAYVHPVSPLQKGCPDIIPGLRAQPWWYLFSKSGIRRSFLGCLTFNSITSRSGSR